MSYNNYTSEDFFHDPKFRQWVLKPEPEITFFWEKWILNNPEKKQEIELARKLVQSIQINEFQWSEKRKSQLWERIYTSNQRKSSQSRIVNLETYQYQINRKRKIANWFKAASIIIILVISVFFIEKRYKGPISQVDFSSSIIKQNLNGQKSKVFLPDGSVVYLNSNSQLTYPEQFEKKQRIVKLTGEAYFEVVSDSTCPFIVKCSQLETTVLGTSFNLKAYPDNNNIDVSLVEGKLRVISTQTQEEILLLTGQSATLSKSDSQLSTGTIDYLEDVAWKDGVLYFKEIPLDQAFQLLQQWYGVEFNFNTSPDSNVHITGEFDNEYLSNVLKSLSYTISFDYEIKNGNDVYIEFN